MTQEIANEDACKIEHVLTTESLDRLTKFVEFIRMKEENPRWLDHFNYFFETGKYIECTPVSSDNCPVHGKDSKGKR